MQQRAPGLIGLGHTGQLYAGHLLRGRGGLVVFDLDRARVQQAVGLGARAAGSAGDLAAQCDDVVLALPHPDAVRAALLGPDGLLAAARAGTLVIDTSTIDPDTARLAYAAARERGVSYLDAPISGGQPGEAGTEGARAASVTFMVGGDREAYGRALPLLGLLGKRFFYLGPAGLR